MTTQTTTSPARTEAERARPPAGAFVARLEPDERLILTSLLEEPTDFIDNEVLHASNATENLFGVSAKLTSAGDTRFAEPEPVVDAKALSGSRVPTLSTEQEQLLFLRLNLTRKRIQDILRRHTGKQLPAASARRLIAWGRWELATRDRIVQLNMPLVLAMAKRTRLTGVDFNEMISEGNMALLRSVDKFDCGRGFKFSTYACRAILKSFSRVAMRTSRYRGTFPVEFEPSIERSDHVERKREGVEADCVSELKSILSQNSADLTAIEETVIRQRFALHDAGVDLPAPKTLEQVGQIIGVTKERVRQIQNKALKKIRTALEEGFLAA
jgi:RNA polymerase primary sigma factor